jgi:hypothetical protein
MTNEAEHLLRRQDDIKSVKYPVLVGSCRCDNQEDFVKVLGMMTAKIDVARGQIKNNRLPENFSRPPIA